MVPTIYYFFWIRYHPSKIYSQKKSWQETKYRPSFPPTTKPRPLNPLDRGPTSLVLAGYRLVVLRPFCACSTVFYVCLPCHSRLVLFHSTSCFVLFLHAFPTTFVIFLWFGFSFLHMIPTANTSCRSLFIFIVLFHISFLAYFLYKRIWASVGQIMLTGSKGSWAQFVFIYRSHSAKELYSATDLCSAADLHFVIDCFPLHFFLWTFLALRFSWWVLLFIRLSSSWYRFKNGHQHSAPWAYGLLLWVICENLCSFLSWVVSQLTCECFSSFLRDPVVSIFSFLRQVVLFLFANSWPSKGSQKNFSSCRWWFCCYHLKASLLQTLPPLGLLYAFLLPNSNSPVLSLGLYSCCFGLPWPISSFLGSFVPFYSFGHPQPIHHFRAPLSYLGSFVPFYSFRHPRPISSLSSSFVPFVFPLGVPSLFAFLGLPWPFS